MRTEDSSDGVEEPHGEPHDGFPVAPLVDADPGAEREQFAEDTAPVREG